MNIAEAFATYMEGLGYGTLGTDLFIGSAPLGATDPCWWVIAGGGSSEPKNNTGERLKNYTLSVFYRNTVAQDVYDTLQEFEERLNSIHCDQLAGYETIEMEAISFPADEDLDQVDRTIGLVEVRVMVYSS